MIITFCQELWGGTRATHPTGGSENIYAQKQTNLVLNVNFTLSIYIDLS